MDAHLGSILNRFYKVEKTTVYVEKLPQDFKRPSIYYPRPDVNEVTAGLHFEHAEHLLKVTIFDFSGNEAFNKAVRIKRNLNDTRKLVEIIDVNGAPQGVFFRVSNIRIRSNDTDSTATLSLNYSVEENYGRDDYKSIEYVNIISEVVDDDGTKENQSGQH